MLPFAFLCTAVKRVLCKLSVEQGSYRHGKPGNVMEFSN